jgi:hypothetical protein
MTTTQKFRDGELIFNIPIVCSHGGIPINEKHIDYWKRRAQTAETALSDSTKCSSCAEPLVQTCPRCQRLWES